MSLKLISIIGLITISLAFYSCSNTINGSNAKDNSIEVISSFKTPVIRGAGQLKGMRIGVQAIVNQAMIDSILYEGKSTTSSLLQTINDTVWVEAYFYPSEYQNNGVPNTTEYSSEKCTVFYHDKSGNKEFVIADLKLVTDPTMWK